jgi:hypothetical protein
LFLFHRGKIYYFSIALPFLPLLKHALSQMANYVMKYATQEGIFLILKNFARATTIKEVSKYIPFVGQLVAAGLGYMIVSNAGESYLNKCHELAEAILTNNLKV